MGRFAAMNADRWQPKNEHVALTHVPIRHAMTRPNLRLYFCAMTNRGESQAKKMRALSPEMGRMCLSIEMVGTFESSPKRKCRPEGRRFTRCTRLEGNPQSVLQLPWSTEAEGTAAQPSAN